MTPSVESKRRVRLKRRLRESGVAKVRKPKENKQFSRAYINTVIKKLLKRRVNVNDPVDVIYRTYRRLIKLVCEAIVRRHRKMTLKEAYFAVAKLIPKDHAMGAIREFRQQPLGTVVGPSAGPSARRSAGGFAGPSAGPSSRRTAGPLAGPLAGTSAGPLVGTSAKTGLSAGPLAGPSAEPSAGLSAVPAARLSADPKAGPIVGPSAGK